MSRTGASGCSTSRTSCRSSPRGLSADPPRRDPRRSRARPPSPVTQASGRLCSTSTRDGSRCSTGCFSTWRRGSLRGDCLTVYCKNEFVRDSLNHNTVLAVLREVTSAAQGRRSAWSWLSATWRRSPPRVRAVRPRRERLHPLRRQNRPPRYRNKRPRHSRLRLNRRRGRSPRRRQQTWFPSLRSGAQLDNFKIK